MKKTILVSLLLILISSLLVLGKQKIGDIRPALLPPGAPTNQTIFSEVDYLQIKEGFKIGIFAQNLDGPRDLEFSPKGTLLVSLPSTGKIVALPDRNKDGRTDSLREVSSGLNRPHGLAFYQDKLFVAEETKVSRYFWEEDKMEAKLDKVLFTLPKGGRHKTRTIAFDNQGKMFVSVGSSCDVCNEKDEFLAAVIESNSDGIDPKLYSKGLRNAVFIKVNPLTNELWGTEMGRDFLGDSAPPDEINLIKEGGNYGWPICYGNKLHDSNFDKNQYIQDPCQETQTPIYEIAAHSAPLGLEFINSNQFPLDWQRDLLVSYHGSWNRSTPIGYKVVRLKVDGNKIIGEEDFLTGFLKGSEAVGRPVDITFEKFENRENSLFISDDKGGIIYKVAKR